MVKGKVKMNTVEQTITPQTRTVPVLQQADIIAVWVHKNTKEFYAEMKDGSLIQMTDRELKAWLL